MRTIFAWLIPFLFLAPQGAAAAFSDVERDDTYVNGILYVQEKGIVEGYGDGTYRADARINRVEFTKIVIAALVDTEVIGRCIQTTAKADLPWDIDTTAWYAPYVCTAKTMGIIGGYPDGSFKPNAEISFAEAAKIVARGFKLETETSGDVWYRSYIEALEDRRAIPLSIGDFAHALTRGEMAEIIYRVHADVTDKLSVQYNDSLTAKVYDATRFSVEYPLDWHIWEVYTVGWEPNAQVQLQEPRHTDLGHIEFVPPNPNYKDRLMDGMDAQVRFMTLEEQFNEQISLNPNLEPPTFATWKSLRPKFDEITVDGQRAIRYSEPLRWIGGEQQTHNVVVSLGDAIVFLRSDANHQAELNAMMQSFRMK